MSRRPQPGAGWGSASWNAHRDWPAQPVEFSELRRARTGDAAPAGLPGPGELIWAWVPFGRESGDGKDRPCAVVATEPDRRSVLVVPLTSREHEDDPDYLFLGYGDWNADGPASWARVSSLLRVPERGIRSRLGALDRGQLRALRTVLRIRS